MKKNFSKKLKLCTSMATFLLMITTLFTRAQSANDWTLQSEINGVKLFSKTEICNGKNSIALKFENTNSTNKHVNCLLAIQGTNSIQVFPLLPKIFDLKANEIKAGSCGVINGLTEDTKNISNPKLKVQLIVN